MEMVCVQHTGGLFIAAMKEVTQELGVPFVDTFDMTLPVLDECRDGVHFRESVTRVLAMLLLKNMEILD